MPKSLFGGFSDPAILSTDADPKKTDPYEKADMIPSRYTGANFKVGRPKKGHGKDAYFSKAFPTFAASDQNPGSKTDEYLDSGVLARREAAAKKEKNIVKQDFKFASPPKRSTGSGSHFGTFDGKPFEHKPDYAVQKRDEPSKKFEVKVQKNILTCPAKKGTYGYMGTTFSKIEGAKVSDEYEAMKKLERERWEASKKKMIATTTFKSTIRPMKSFDEKKSTGVSSAYDHYDAPEEKKSKRAPKPPKEDKDKDKAESRPVFKFSSGTKSGRDGCLNKFPNTRGDKEDPYDAAALRHFEKKNGKETEKKDPSASFIGGTWKPVSCPKKGVVRSLLKTYY